MTRSPRARFQDSKEDTLRHLEIVSSPSFARALDAAVLQMVHTQPLLKDAHDAVARAHQIQGARDFIEVLKTLADKPEAVRRVNVGNLDGNVRSEPNQ